MSHSSEIPEVRKMDDPSGHGLTAREREVAVLVAGSLTNIEIGARLHISPGTVKRHVATVMLKLGASRRVEVARPGPP
jgi:DNA-binding CsgD family transcriptional regulator